MRAETKKGGKRTSSGTYLRIDPEFSKHNYDPYRRLVLYDVDPEEATQKAGFFRRLLQSLPLLHKLAN